ncbi:helix-turn-helix domain-containing protein [Adlercreutzia sp. ZJ304]|uniref:helix-turn-helix domain-containing protein n=1 Tax=Adlercreutzia sp. ZJ304 TaxID=2709791 RepID=UPI0013ECE400|nr:helix-turn-helix domain-containing protein [Adlercreutzia sp. ZJ304]
MDGVRISRQASKHFNDAFKRQIVELHMTGKSVIDICREYNLKDSPVHGWIKRYKDDGRTCHKVLDTRAYNRSMSKRTGKIIIQAGANPWPHELKSAEALSAAGYAVEFIKKSEIDYEHTADMFLNGVL